MAVKKGKEDLIIYLIKKHKKMVKKGFRKVGRAKRNNSLSLIENRPKIVKKRSSI